MLITGHSRSRSPERQDLDVRRTSESEGDFVLVSENHNTYTLCLPKHCYIHYHMEQD